MCARVREGGCVRVCDGVRGCARVREGAQGLPAAPERKPHIEPVEEGAAEAAGDADEQEDRQLGQRVGVILRKVAEGDEPRVGELAEGRGELAVGLEARVGGEQ